MEIGDKFENLALILLGTRHKFPREFKPSSFKNSLKVPPDGFCGYQCSTEFLNSKSKSFIREDQMILVLG